jgi:ABC-2 type transport system ATP-binding protein
MDKIIEISNLSKTYGEIVAVNGVQFSVPPGEIFGYLGPNGAGKTTTIRMIMNFLTPSGGEIRVFGMNSSKEYLQIHKRIGYMNSDMKLYEHLTGNEMLLFLSNLRGGVDKDNVERLSEKLDIDLSLKIRNLSRGNKQKIALIQAFMHRPELVILDEPSNGLDPLMQQQFNEIVKQSIADGSTVFLSSHILPEVEVLCDRVAIIKDGVLVAEERVDVLKKNSVQKFEIIFSVKPPENIFQQVRGISNISIDDRVLTCSIIGAIDPFIKEAANFDVQSFKSFETDLEDIFLSFYKGSKPK